MPTLMRASARWSLRARLVLGCEASRSERHEKRVEASVGPYRAVNLEKRNVKYHSVVEAKSMTGLRLVLSAGVPGPWSEAAKAVLKARNVSYAPVAQTVMAAFAKEETRVR